MYAIDSHLRLPLQETIGEVCRLQLLTDVSDRMLARYGLGPRSKITRVRSRLSELKLTIHQIESMDRHALWELIFSKK